MYACLFRRMYCYFSFFTNLYALFINISLLLHNHYSYECKKNLCQYLHTCGETALHVYLLTDTEINRCHPT